MSSCVGQDKSLGDMYFPHYLHINFFLWTAVAESFVCTQGKKETDKATFIVFYIENEACLSGIGVPGNCTPPFPLPPR